MNISTILTGSRDHDLNIKLTWAKPLEQMGHKVFIVGRTDHPNVICMYNEPYKIYATNEQREIERQLPFSFKYISSLDWRQFNKNDCKDSKNIERTNQYMTFLADWYFRFYRDYKIECLTIAFESNPWNLMAYYVARQLKIPVVNLMNSRFPKRGFMFGKDDYSQIHRWNGDKADWDKILSLYPDQKYVKGTGLKFYWSIQSVQNNAQKALQYLKTRKDMGTITPHERTALPPLKSEFDRLFWSTIRGIYNKIFWQEPQDEEYFFYPFHFEEDSNITIMEPFTNQVQLAQSISRCLPVGVKLYIKPHPYFNGIDVRFHDLYHLTQLPNVRIINPLYSPVSLLKKSVAVITLNSTTGFEALIFDKPVISLGHDFYCHDHLVYLIRSWNDLPKTIFNVYKTRQPRADRELSQQFVEFIYSNTVWTKGDIALAEDALTNRDGERMATALDRVFKNL